MTVQEEVRQRIDRDALLAKLRGKIGSGKATYDDTAAYSNRAGKLLGEIFSRRLPEIDLSDREALCAELLRERYTDINALCDRVQRALDETQGLHLRPQHAPFDSERAHQIGGSTADTSKPEKVRQRRAGSATETMTKSMHDDRIKAEAKFRSRAGLDCRITRVAVNGCCPWCSKFAGRYDYGSEPKDVYHRHDNCDCTVTFENGRKRQDVWSKREWEAPEPDAGAGDAVVLTEEQAKTLETEKDLTKLSDNDILRLENALTRRDKNIGAFAELEIPMQKRAVIKVCNKYGIDIKGLRFKIQREEYYLHFEHDVFGSADDEDIGRIDLFPKAFSNEEQLVRTIVHERLHVLQLRKHGKEYCRQHLGLMERQAYWFEDAIYPILRKRVKP